MLARNPQIVSGDEMTTKDQVTANASVTEAPTGDSTTEERRARRIAQYEQAGEMARQHASYRFTMFGFFVTIITALFAAGGWLLFEKCEYITAAVVSGFGAIVAAVAIAVDARTWELYKASQEYCEKLEKKWPGGEEEGPGGFFNYLGAEIAKAKGLASIRHTFALNALYYVSILGSVLLIIYALWLRTQPSCT
jgi:hypothetical protein